MPTEPQTETIQFARGRVPCGNVKEPAGEVSFPWIERLFQTFDGGGSSLVWGCIFGDMGQVIALEVVILHVAPAVSHADLPFVLVERRSEEVIESGISLDGDKGKRRRGRRGRHR